MSKNFFRGITIGALVATAATLLLAPKSGVKTRKDVQKLVKTLSKKMEKEFGDLSQISKDRYEAIVGTALKEYAKTSKVAKNFISEANDVLKKQWSEIQKELKK